MREKSQFMVNLINLDAIVTLLIEKRRYYSHLSNNLVITYTRWPIGCTAR